MADGRCDICGEESLELWPVYLDEDGEALGFVCPDCEDGEVNA